MRYRQAFQRERIMEDIVRHLTTENEELQIYCASAIFRVSYICENKLFTTIVIAPNIILT